MTKFQKICYDRILPHDLYSGYTPPARSRGVRAIIVKNKMWPNGSQLKVRFLGGTPAQQALVRQHAVQWSQYANISFAFVDDEEAQIRVAFLDDGAWSAVGTDSLDGGYFPKDEPTLNLGWVDEGVILHEFGHSLGLGHEHQSPFGGIQWNEPVVITALQGSPNFWSPEETRHNVIRKYSFAQVNGTQFDPNSVMLYFFPATWTINGVGTHENDKLSQVDKDFIASAQAYPKGTSQDDLLTELKVGARRFKPASIGAPGEEDLYIFNLKSAGFHTIETRGPTDLVMRLYGPNDRTRLLDEDDDGGQAFNARIARQLDSGEYMVQVRHYNRKKGTGDYRVRVS